MQKRVGLPRHRREPEIIFFERTPPPALMRSWRASSNELIREIVTEWARTAMTITHDMSHPCAAIADNVAMLAMNGVIKWTGPVTARWDNFGRILI